MDLMSTENREIAPRPDQPIVENADSVSFLGVRLEKAKAAPTINVPRRDQYADFINDRFALDLQKQIAVSFLQGSPMLIEGGTSLGKTTTVRKMCADLGYEVHYANLNFGADETKLMGKPMPNTKRNSPDDPEYVYWLGKISAGLVPEEGKVKVIVIDEIGAATPGNLIMIHEVLDSIERGTPIDLSEWGNGFVPVDKDRVKIVAMTNPPGRGYLGRTPLDPALLRRFTYLKAPSELPEETFSYTTKSLFGLASQVESVLPESFLISRDQVLLNEQLQEIPGIVEIVARYEEFHKSAKQLVKERRIGADQPQLFTYDDRVEPKRVHDFVLSFFNGDITETFQKALRYYYANKVESAADKVKLEELISHVAYQDVQTSSARRPVAASPSPEQTLTRESDSSERTELINAMAILGKENVVIPSVIDGRYVTEHIPTIPFSRAELEKAKELGQFLIYRVDKDPEGGPLTMKALQEIVQAKFSREGKGKVLYDTDWYKDEEFFTKETPTAGWALVSKEVIPGSTSKNYLQQIDVIENYVRNNVFRGGVVPLAYQEAFAEYADKKDHIGRLLGSDWKAAANELAELRVNKIFRQSPVEAIYDLMVYFAQNGERQLGGMYTWTNKQSSSGDLVNVGGFGEVGAYVGYDGPGGTDGRLGVVFSR